MAAVIRLKRRLDEEPVDTLLLNCKRRKTTNDDTTADISTVVTLAGTADDSEEDILKHVKIQTKEELEDQYKKHSTDMREKLRVQRQLAVRDSRYKVVNLRRFDKDASDKLTIVDIENEEKETGASVKDDLKYVYDLYYMPKEKVSELNMEDVDVFPWEDPVELVYDNPNEEEDDSDSDSNAENNWRNDYPDEEDDITEQDMMDAMNRLDVAGERDLSSDDGEEGFVYSIDSEGIGFEEDVDPTDVSRYGEMYARFKARVKHSDNLGGGSYDSWSSSD